MVVVVVGMTKGCAGARISSDGAERRPNRLSEPTLGLPRTFGCVRVRPAAEVAP